MVSNKKYTSPVYQFHLSSRRCSYLIYFPSSRSSSPSTYPSSPSNLFFPPHIYSLISLPCLSFILVRLLSHLSLFPPHLVLFAIFHHLSHLASPPPSSLLFSRVTFMESEAKLGDGNKDKKVIDESDEQISRRRRRGLFSHQESRFEMCYPPAMRCHMSQDPNCTFLI